MKKFDFVIIAFILFVISLFTIFFIRYYKKNDESLYIDILYKNELLYSVNLNDDGEYYIECINNELTIKKNNELIKYKNIESKDFFNTFIINEGEVKMVDASCSGKDCTNMYITKNHTLPIICTNGIILNPSEKSDIDITV